jgi:hypothetical protein
METWSHLPVKEFKTIVFVDTNILCYLIDETYPSLNRFIEYIKDNSLIDLISSEYVLLEFIGVRKREHYLRESLSRTRSLNKPINVSSLLKYHNQYSLPEIDFYSLLPQIKNNVDSEKDKITSGFGIAFSSGFHRDLLNPTSDICLGTKISKEDSLALVSSILPNDSNANENVIFLTNDADLCKWFHESKDIIKDVSQKHGIITNLRVERINGISNQQINLTKNNDLNLIQEKFISYIKEATIQKSKELFLGYSFVPDNESLNDYICFKADQGKKIFSKKYISIIGKDLNFVYNTTEKINIWHKKCEIPDDGFVASKGDSFLSLQLPIDDSVPEKANILTKLKEGGNLIFIHPDN